MIKKCVICLTIFHIRKQARTAETRTLCKLCKQAIKKIVERAYARKE